VGIPFKVLHTGQHYDYTMSELHFTSLGLHQPDFYLGIGSDTHGRQTARMLQDIEEILVRERPDMVMVYGDTNSTMAGALSAAKLCIKIGHVEAGVRSYDRRMPEEINRVVTDHVSDHHFCPTENAVEILKSEGIGGTFTGDVMYDALLQVSGGGLENPLTGSYVLVTIHRAENTDDPKRFLAVWEALKTISRETEVVFPVHPRTRKLFGHILSGAPLGIRVMEPVSYLSMLAMVHDARCMVTDSGGVQKEAFLLGCPCVTVRETTEWPETVQAGANILVEAVTDSISNAVIKMMDKNLEKVHNPFGDGKASLKIAGFIQDHYR